MPSPAPHTTAVGRLWPHAAGTGALRALGLVAGGSALLALAAHVQVPFWPVRLSLQSLVVVLIGIAYGSRLGAATLVAYVAEGALGLPVFQGGAGPLYLAGPTGGYLLGYILSALVAGLAAERGALARPAPALAAVFAAVAAIYLPGVAWLAVLFGPGKAVAFGLTPFLAGEALKMALVLALLPALQAFSRAPAR